MIQEETFMANEIKKEFLAEHFRKHLRQCHMAFHILRFPAAGFAVIGRSLEKIVLFQSSCSTAQEKIRAVWFLALG